MKTYVVTERHNVSLGPGTVFQANPEDVAGALKNGAIVEVETSSTSTNTTNQQKPAQPAQTVEMQAQAAQQVQQVQQAQQAK